MIPVKKKSSSSVFIRRNKLDDDIVIQAGGSMRIYLREFRRTTPFTIFCAISMCLFLAFAACSATRETNSSTLIETNSPEQAKREIAASQQWTRSDGAITGAFTINGKRVNLKHTYARRNIYEPTKLEKYPVIEIILADKPVSDGALTAMFAVDEDQIIGYGKPFTKDKNLLGATLTNALLFRIKKGQNNMSSIGYSESVLTADGLLYPVGVLTSNFEEFDLKKGAVTAKAKNEIEESVRVPDGAGNTTRETDLTYSYTVSFQARLANAPAIASAGDSPQSPEEGTATGELNLRGNVSAMKYAYARREKVFFDEPETIVHVLITDVPIPKEHVAAALNNDFLPDALQVKGIHLKTDTDGKLEKYSLREWGVSVAISMIGQANELAVKELAAAKDRVKGRVVGNDETNKRSFSVTFDAPL